VKIPRAPIGFLGISPNCIRSIFANAKAICSIKAAHSRKITANAFELAILGSFCKIADFFVDNREYQIKGVRSMGTIRDVIRIERWSGIERVSFGNWNSECWPELPSSMPTVEGDAQVEWDRVMAVAEENDIAHCLDSVAVRDHCLKVALGGDPAGMFRTERRAYWDFRSFPQKFGASCGGVADESVS